MKNTFKLVYLFFLISACNAGHQHNVDKAEALLEEGKKLEQINRPESAIAAYQEAISLLSRTDEDGHKGELYNHLGDIYYMQNIFHRALNAHQEALRYNERLSDKAKASYSLRAIGKDLCIWDKPRQGLNYFIKAYHLIDSIKDKEEIARIHNNLATSYCELNNYHLALKHTNIALRMSNDSIFLYKNLFMKGNIYSVLNIADSAYYYYRLGGMSSNIYTKTGSYGHLSEMKEYIGDSEAIKYYEIHKVLKDSIDKMELTTSIEQSELKREFQEKTKRYNYQLYLIVLFALVLSVLMFWHRKKLKIKKKRVEEQEQEINILDNELKEIQNRHLQAQKELSQLVENSEIEKELEKHALFKAEKVKAEQEFFETINEMGDLCKTRLLASKEYLKVKSRITGGNSLSYQEIKEFSEYLLTTIFKNYIRQLSVYIDLRDDDYYLCCLSLAEFSDEECAACRAVTPSAIRTQRSRIKKNIRSSFTNEYIFYKIFPEKRDSCNKEYILNN